MFSPSTYFLNHAKKALFSPAPTQPTACNSFLHHHLSTLVSCINTRFHALTFIHLLCFNQKIVVLVDSLNYQHATANKESFSPITRFLYLSWKAQHLLKRNNSHHHHSPAQTKKQQPKVYSPPPTHTTSKHPKSTHGESTKRQKENKVKRKKEWKPRRGLLLL